jgi:hypothetical protein
MNLRRPGVNEGDIVRIKPKHVRDYERVHTFLPGERFTVGRRRLASTSGASYWLELQGQRSGGTVLAKPGHLEIVAYAEECRS